jgi:carbon starvation protein
LLAVSTFLLTTLDTCTRLARFLVEELTGMRGSWGRYLGTAVTLIIPAVMVFVEIPGPNGTTLPAWRAIWPAFGATNQLLGALALLVVYTWLRHTGRKSWYVFWPMVFMFVTTLLALVMLVRRNLGPEGNVYVGIVSLALAVLAVLVLVNAVWRWRLSPVTGTAAPSVS